MKPVTMTLTITDNPLAGQPGQNDITIVVSGEPDIAWNGGDPPPGLLDSKAFCAAVGMLTYLAGETAAMNLMRMPGGSSQ